MFLFWLHLFLEISLADVFSLTTLHCPDALLSSHTGGIRHLWTAMYQQGADGSTVTG